MVSERESLFVLKQLTHSIGFAMHFALSSQRSICDMLANTSTRRPLLK